MSVLVSLNFLVAALGAYAAWFVWRQGRDMPLWKGLIIANLFFVLYNLGWVAYAVLILKWRHE